MCSRHGVDGFGLCGFGFPVVAGLGLWSCVDQVPGFRLEAGVECAPLSWSADPERCLDPHTRWWPSSRCCWTTKSANLTPTATFTSTGVRAEGDKYTIDGDFTLKGVTKLVTLDLEFNAVVPVMGCGEVAGFSVSVVLNRKDFGIDAALPFDTGSRVVGDKATITLEIEALKQV